MSDIYVPIDFSDLKSVIPPGEDIIYSTLCKGIATIDEVTKRKTTTWITHVLFTQNGVAWVKPHYTKKRKTPTQEYTPLVDINYLFYDIIPSFRIGPARLFLAREKIFETKENFRERSVSFLPRFAPLIIEKKEQWLREYGDNPEIKERLKKRIRKHITKMKNQLRDELAKRARKAEKAAKKK